MSVAFRRDSDEEHREPRFELPLPAGPNPVTPRGLAQIEAREAELAAALAVASADEREDVARTLRYWSTRKTTAQVAPPPAPGIAGIGSRVTLTLNGRERTIEIVGHDEAEPAADRIAWNAPLARALIGAEVGETIDFGGASAALEVLAIAP